MYHGTAYLVYLMYLHGILSSTRSCDAGLGYRSPPEAPLRRLPAEAPAAEEAHRAALEGRGRQGRGVAHPDPAAPRLRLCFF